MAVSSTVPVTGPGSDDVGRLVRRAARGDQVSWDALVARFGPMVWSIARSMGRSPAEAADVSQTVWLSLLEHLDTILQPERVGAWLATTTRRECLRVQQRAQRFTLVDDETRFDDVDQGLGSVDTGMLSKERNEALWDTFRSASRAEPQAVDAAHGGSSDELPGHLLDARHADRQHRADEGAGPRRAASRGPAPRDHVGRLPAVTTGDLAAGRRTAKCKNLRTYAALRQETRGAI